MLVAPNLIRAGISETHRREPSSTFISSCGNGFVKGFNAPQIRRIHLSVIEIHA